MEKLLELLVLGCEAIDGFNRCGSHAGRVQLGCVVSQRSAAVAIETMLFELRAR